MIDDCEEAYYNGRKDLKEEILEELKCMRQFSLGVVRATLGDVIEKIEKI